MNDRSTRIGCRSSSLVLALALAIGCSSQQEGHDAVDAGLQCGVISTVPIQHDPFACTVVILLPPTAQQNPVRLMDQSMVPIPYAGRSGQDGWTYGDPEAPYLLVGSYCRDATEGRITSVTFVVDCPIDSSP